MSTRTSKLLRELNLSGVAITAEVKQDGCLHPVGGGLTKLLAAARERSLPRIHTVVVAKDQRPGIECIDPGLLRDDPHAEFRVICASDLLQAIKLLKVDAETRWEDVIDCTTEVERHRDFVGRGWLKKQVQAFVAGHDSGYLLLTGGPGVGKSAFVAEQVRDNPSPCVYHFIMRGMGNWNEPEAILRSLSAQLRRKYVLPQTDTERRMKPDAAFPYVLQRVSRSLEEGRKEVLYLDGLDQASELTERSARVELPRVLPKGIYLVITSRSGVDLNCFRDPHMHNVSTIEIEKNKVANMADVEQFLTVRATQVTPLLTQDFITRAALRTRGNFYIAWCKWKQILDNPSDASDPETWPETVWDLHAEIYQRIKDAALGKSIPEPRIWRTLGLLSLARAPLSLEHLDGFGLLDNYAESILDLSREFFYPRLSYRDPKKSYIFNHPSVPEFVTEKLLLPSEKSKLQNTLVDCCSRWQKLPSGAARDYALRFYGLHVFEAAPTEMTFDRFYALYEEGFFENNLEGVLALPSNALEILRLLDAGKDHPRYAVGVSTGG